ncbi:hypothetical protein CDIK_4541, partial [Cucumispora dikerogammari]
MKEIKLFEQMSENKGPRESHTNMKYISSRLTETAPYVDTAIDKTSIYTFHNKKQIFPDDTLENNIDITDGLSSSVNSNLTGIEEEQLFSFETKVQSKLNFFENREKNILSKGDINTTEKFPLLSEILSFDESYLDDCLNQQQAEPDLEKIKTSLYESSFSFNDVVMAVKKPEFSAINDNSFTEKSFKTIGSSQNADYEYNITSLEPGRNISVISPITELNANKKTEHVYYSSPCTEIPQCGDDEGMSALSCSYMLPDSSSNNYNDNLTYFD